MSLETHWVAVGRVTRAHGVHGEVAVLPLSIVESRFQPGSRLSLGQSESRLLTVRSARPHRRMQLEAEVEVVQLRQVFHPQAADPVVE